MNLTRCTRFLITCVLLLPIGAQASPSLKGGTGLINLPTATTSTGTSFYYQDGAAITNGIWAMGGGFFEGGMLRREGENLYNLKMKFLPEAGWIPASAVGVRGMASTNDQREYYMVLSKYWAYPSSIISLGVLRSGSATEGTQNVFGGIEIPFFGRGRVLGEYDGKTETYNAGLGYYLNQSIYLYYHFLDVSSRGSPEGQDKVFGVTYSRSF